MDEWIKNLKVGDKVIVSGRFNLDFVDQVVKILPSGNIKTSKSLFKPNGFERSSDRWNTNNISQYTEEKQNKINHRIRCHFLTNVTFIDLPADVVQQIYTLVKSNIPKNKSQEKL